MISFIKSIFPAEFRKDPAYWRAFTLGLVVLIMAVLQLFQFEDYPGVFTYMRVPGGAVVAWVLAAGIPLLEIASLPYLLSMRISRRLRGISKKCTFTVAGLWLAVTLWAAFTQGPVVESGVFGAAMPVTSSLWSVAFALLFAWSVYLLARELSVRR